MKRKFFISFLLALILAWPSLSFAQNLSPAQRAYLNQLLVPVRSEILSLSNQFSDSFLDIATSVIVLSNYIAVLESDIGSCKVDIEALQNRYDGLADAFVEMGLNFSNYQAATLQVISNLWVNYSNLEDRVFDLESWVNSVYQNTNTIIYLDASSNVVTNTIIYLNY